MLSYIKNKYYRLGFICVNIILIALLLGGDLGQNNDVYSAVIDRINGEIATVLIADINTQCILPVAELPGMASHYEQIWLSVEYNQQTEICQFVAIDFKKTAQQKDHVLELQKNLRQTSN